MRSHKRNLNAVAERQRHSGRPNIRISTRPGPVDHVFYMRTYKHIHIGTVSSAAHLLLWGKLCQRSVTGGAINHSGHNFFFSPAVWELTSSDKWTLLAQDNDLGAHGLSCLLDGQTAFFIHVENRDSGVHTSFSRHCGDDCPGYYWS